VKLISLLLLFSLSAFASSTRLQQGDVLISSDTTKTWTPGGPTGTLMNSSGIVQEIPAGTCNGSTTTFTLANTPNVALTVSLYLDGLLLLQGAGKDYTISTATITLTTACATGQTLTASYSKY
jgi:hypothetical protein